MVTVVIFVWVPFHVIVEDYVVLVVITIYVTIASTSSNVQEGPYANNIYICDRCRIRTNCSNGRWHCYSCKFDLCVGCASTHVLNYYNPPQPKVEIVKDPDTVDVNEKLKCNICMDKTVEYVLIPCGHMLCRECSQKSNKCPFDRNDITQKIKMYYHKL